jgi:hypothetical protein
VNNLAPATPAAGAPNIEEAPRGNAHWWFTALDQRSLAVGAERWLTQVVGVHVKGSEVWIQLQSLPEQLQDFTIRVRPDMTVDDVVTAVAAQIRSVTRSAG